MVLYAEMPYENMYAVAGDTFTPYDRGTAVFKLRGQDWNTWDSFDLVFKTYVVPDTTAPSTTATPSPAPNAAGWNSSDVLVTLNAADEGGASVKEITYSATNGGQQIASDTVQGDSTSVPVTVEGETTITYHATDSAGNAESEKTLIVKLDKSAPSVSDTTPDHRERGVERDIEPTATFSEGMDLATLNASTVKLYRWNAKSETWRPVVAAVSTDGNTTSLDPYPRDSSKLLAANKKYRVTITTRAENLASISLDQDTNNDGNQRKVWSFTTGAS
jgi:hypothetical protein